MRKGRCIQFAVVLAAGVCGLVWLLYSQLGTEPVYLGKRLSVWLDAKDRPLSYGIEPYEAREAVRLAGTNAIPSLLRFLRAQDPPWKLKMMEWTQKQHWLKIKF